VSVMSFSALTAPEYPIRAHLLIGPTGVGKSPLGEMIARCGLLGRTCHHLDFGSELRRVLSGGEYSAPYTPDELDFIRGVLERGLLLENEHFPLAEKIISLFLRRVAFSRKNLLILNGIPRHEGQVRSLEKTILVTAVIVLDCCAADIRNRIESNVGGDRTERVDDTVDLIEKKLLIFRERTAPLVNHYEKQGCRTYRISVNSMMNPVEAYNTLSRLAAAHPPVAFVAEPPEG
jgi:adenylate kinase